MGLVPLSLFNPSLNRIAPSDTPAEREGRKRHDFNTGRLWDAPLRRTNTITERSCTRNKGTARKPLPQRVFRRVLHKQHASVMRTFRANACFCLTFPIGSKFSSLQRSLGARTRCPPDTPALDDEEENRIAPGGWPTMASPWKDGGARTTRKERASRASRIFPSETRGPSRERLDRRAALPAPARTGRVIF